MYGEYIYIHNKDTTSLTGSSLVKSKLSRRDLVCFISKSICIDYNFIETLKLEIAPPAKLILHKIPKENQHFLIFLR